MRVQVLGVGTVLAILLNGAAGASTAADACAGVPPALGKYQGSATGGELPAAVPYFDAAGKERPLEELRGQGLVLNFWATWCAPCVKEMPALDRLAAEAKRRGFRVLALSADREGASVVRKFYEVNNIRHLHVAVDKMSRVARAAAVTGLPTTVLYDAGSREVGRVVGVAEWDTTAAVDFLSRCLGGQS